MYDLHVVFIKQWRLIIPIIVVLVRTMFCTTQSPNDTYAEYMRTNKMNCTDTETGMCLVYNNFKNILDYIDIHICIYRGLTHSRRSAGGEC